MAIDAVSPVDMAVVKSINEIAHLLGVKTIASGVDNELALKEVKKLGIDYVQGAVVGGTMNLKEIKTKAKWISGE